MKNFKLTFLFFFLFTQFSVFSQSINSRDDTNGDWTEQHVILYNTSEADIMVRTGDIDNLGFGWPTNFDPFSGNHTPSHGFPWVVDTLDAMGTDRIMVVTSYVGSPPYGSDGYTRSTNRPENLPRPIVLSYNLDGLSLESAMFQVFADDFQHSTWGANYFVTINGVDAPFVATVINSLNQGGPIGKVVNVAIPEDYLYLLEQDSLSILFDDTTTGAGDGYAIDFLKLLLNPKGFSYTAKVFGYVTNTETGNPIPNVSITASGIGGILTNEEGYFIFDSLPAGITNLFATKFSYDTVSYILDLVSGDSVQRDFQLREILEADFEADYPSSAIAPHTVQFTDLSSKSPTIWSWNFGDGTTSEEQNPTHTYTENGKYTVTLTASNVDETNTKVKVDYITIGIDGINEVIDRNSINISPNPLSSECVVTFEMRKVVPLTISIMDISGRVVKSPNMFTGNSGENRVKFVTTDLQNGIYFISIDVGNAVVTKKILVMR